MATTEEEVETLFASNFSADASQIHPNKKGFDFLLQENNRLARENATLRHFFKHVCENVELRSVGMITSMMAWCDDHLKSKYFGVLADILDKSDSRQSLFRPISGRPASATARHSSHTVTPKPQSAARSPVAFDAASTGGQMPSRETYYTTMPQNVPVENTHTSQPREELPFTNSSYSEGYQSQIKSQVVDGSLPTNHGNIYEQRLSKNTEGDPEEFSDFVPRYQPPAYQSTNREEPNQRFPTPNQQQGMRSTQHEDDMHSATKGEEGDIMYSSNRYLSSRAYQNQRPVKSPVQIVRESREDAYSQSPQHSPTRKSQSPRNFEYSQTKETSAEESFSSDIPSREIRSQRHSASLEYESRKYSPTRENKETYGYSKSRDSQNQRYSPLNVTDSGRFSPPRELKSQRYSPPRGAQLQRHSPSREVRPQHYSPTSGSRHIPSPVKESQLQRYSPSGEVRHQQYSPSREPQPERYSPSRESQTQRYSPSLEPRLQRYSPSQESQYQRYSPSRESKPQRYSPSRDSQKQRHSPSRESQPQRYSPSRDSQTQRYSPSRESQPQSYSPSRDSQQQRYSPSRESQTQKYSSPRESRNQRYSPSRESQPDKHSPSRESQPQRYSPSREPQQNRYSPSRESQPQRYSPSREPQNQRYSPSREAQPRRYSPSRESESQRHSPSRESHPRRFSPSRESPSRDRASPLQRYSPPNRAGVRKYSPSMEAYNSYDMSKQTSHETNYSPEKTRESKRYTPPHSTRISSPYGESKDKQHSNFYDQQNSPMIRSHSPSSSQRRGRSPRGNAVQDANEVTDHRKSLSSERRKQMSARGSSKKEYSGHVSPSQGRYSPANTSSKRSPRQSPSPIRPYSPHKERSSPKARSLRLSPSGRKSPSRQTRRDNSTMKDEKRSFSPSKHVFPSFGQDETRLSHDDTSFGGADDTSQFERSVNRNIAVGDPIATSTPFRKSILDVIHRPAVDRELGISPVLTEEKLLRLETSKQTKRILGEIAFQLDRRILEYVFIESIQSRRHKRRFYGYTIANIGDKIQKESLDERGIVDSRKKLLLGRRLEEIIRTLGKFGYKVDIHSDFSLDMVNKFGLLQSPPDQQMSLSMGLDDPAILRLIVCKFLRGQERENELILLDCLMVLAHVDKKPFFVW